MIYHTGKFFFAVFFRVFFFLKVRGQENFPRSGGFIVASNHVSYLDPILLGVASPRSLNYMARDTLFRNSFFGWILKQVHVFPLKRNFADLGAIKEALKRMKSGRGILLFPEGTRSHDGQMKGGLEGVGFLARKGKVPVIPAYVHGADRAWPKHARFFRPACIQIVFGKPLGPFGGQEISDAELTRQIMQQIRGLRDSISPRSSKRSSKH